MAGWFYPPPPPVIGGAASGGQPYDPGRRVTPPQAPPDPPFGHPAIRNAVNFGIIGASWIPAPPLPVRIPPPYTVISGADNPQFGHPARLSPSVYNVIKWSWEPPPPVPTHQWTGNEAPYSIPPPPPDPPFGHRAIMLAVNFSTIHGTWQPRPPPPVQIPPPYAVIPNAVVDNPPIKGTDWTIAVLRAWQPPDPMPVQLIQNVVQEGPFIPPLPPAEEPARFFGGGPFWRRYGYGSAYDAIRRAACEDDEEEIISPDIEEIIDAAARTVVSKPSIRHEPIMVDYDRAIAEVRRGLRAEFEEWRGESRRIREEDEQDDLMAIIIALGL